MDRQQHHQNVTMHMPMLTLSDVLSRVLNYVVEGGAVALAAYVIPQKKMDVKEVVLIALTAAAVFAVLDIFAPTVGTATRHGAGLGIGASLVGFNGVNPIGNATLA